MDYYQIPLDLKKVSHKKDLSRCNLRDSVAGMIHLISTSGFGECKHDDSFGCDIWNHDFENITNAQAFKESVRKSLKEAITRYEKRIEFVNVEIEIEQVMASIKKRRVKNRIVVHVTGKLAMTNEDFIYSEQFFIGPLSYF